MRARAAFLAASLAAAGCGGGGGPQGGWGPVRVVFSEAKTEDVAEKVSLVGSLAANETVELRAELAGTVEAVLFKEGERVAPGRVLFKIDERKVRARVQEAEAALSLSKANIERGDSLLQAGTISRQEYDQLSSRFQGDQAALELAKRQLDDATVEAPFGGAVGARRVSPGQAVQPGEPLASIFDDATLKLEAEVPERYAGRLREGLPVELSVAAYPRRTFQGRLYFVSPGVDPDARTVQVKADVPNKEALLKPGMFANMDLVLEVRRGAVTVPESAVLSRGGAVTVYVADKDAKAELRPVRLGTRLSGRVEVLEGVKAGEKVVVEGTQKIFPGAALTSADAPSPPAVASGTEAAK